MDHVKADFDLENRLSFNLLLSYFLFPSSIWDIVINWS